jgi:hypothetical protein
MKKLLLAALIFSVLISNSNVYAGGGWGNGGRGGGSYRGGCYNGNQFWGSFAGGAAGAAIGTLFVNTVSQPQVIVREVVPVAPVVYPLPGAQYRNYYINGVLYYEQIHRIVICPNCQNKVNCDNIPAGSNAQCPICGNILF